MGLLEEEKQLLEERVKELIIQLEKSQQREKVSGWIEVASSEIYQCAARFKSVFGKIGHQ